MKEEGTKTKQAFMVSHEMSLPVSCRYRDIPKRLNFLTAAVALVPG